MTIPPLPDDAKTPEELFAQVDHYIDQVHEIIDRRDFLELRGLDDFVEYLCGRIVTMSEDEAKKYAPQLTGLWEDMNELQQRLEGARDTVRDDIDKLNKQAAATKAYKKKET